MRVDLGSGLYADLKEVSELRGGDRRAVNAATEVLIQGDGDERRAVLPGDADDNMRYALLARVITVWNLPHPLPASPKVLDELPLDQQDALFKAVQPHMQVITGKTPTPQDQGSVPTSA